MAILIRSALAFAATVGVLMTSAASAATTRFYEGSFEEQAASVAVVTTRQGGHWSFRRFDLEGLQVPCSDGSSVSRSRSVYDRVRLDEDGAFRTEGRRGDIDDGRLIRIAGTISGRRASGVLQYWFEKPGPDDAVCETGKLHWKARAAGDTAMCAGREATIVGSDDRDSIEGTRAADVIVAGAGRDVIKAAGGDDVVCAGAADDKTRGEGGDDAIFTQGGGDPDTFEPVKAGREMIGSSAAAGGRG